LGGVLKARLVFPFIEQAALEEFSKCCLITGRDSSLEDACNWAQAGGGEDPDLIMINCASCFSGSQLPDSLSKKTLLRSLSALKKNRPASRLVLLLPAAAASDTRLIGALLQAGIYNFWFQDGYDEKDIADFVYTDRDWPELEAYLEQCEKDLKHVETAGSRKRAWRMPGGFKRIYQPYGVKSNLIAFWSDDDVLLNYGTAVLTSVDLAESGFKVALVETVTGIPRLAASLSLPHPYFNTRHALSMFARRKTDSYRTCLFNADRYEQDKHTPAVALEVKDFPPNLYFLPDGGCEDHLNWAEMENNWRSFVTELARALLLQQDFNFLVFCGQGKSVFNDVVMNELANLRFITVNMLPGSLVYGLREMKEGPGKTHLIGTSKIGYVEDQLSDLKKPPFLYPPPAFAAEFTDYVYVEKKSRLSLETRRFIKQVTGLIGVKADPEEPTGVRGGLMRLGNLLKTGRR